MREIHNIYQLKIVKLHFHFTTIPVHKDELTCFVVDRENNSPETICGTARGIFIKRSLNTVNILLAFSTYSGLSMKFESLSKLLTATELEQGSAPS